MSNAEIVVPKSDALKQLHERLGELVSQAQSIVVKDQMSYALAASIRTGFKSYLDAVKFQTGPGISEAKERLDRLKQEESIFLNPGKESLLQLDGKMFAFREEEKRQAKVEQDRKNAELRRQQEEKAEADRLEGIRIAAAEKKRKMAEIQHFLDTGKIGKREAARQLKAIGEHAQAAIEEAAAAHEEALKAPPPTVTVKPNIPTVAGAPRNQTYYTATVDNEQAIIDAFCQAIVDKDEPRARFLRRFLQANEAEIGKFARDTKSSEKATALLPGVVFSSRG